MVDRKIIYNKYKLRNFIKIFELFKFNQTSEYYIIERIWLLCIYKEDLHM